MPFLLFGFTKIQQFNINLLKNKEGIYVGAELVIVLLAIYLGARLGGIGIGFAGGLGVLVLTLIFQIKPGAIPFDVIEIIMAVIAAIAAMQVAGGMDYLVSLAERMLRRHPKYITFLAPLVTWFMTVLAGTGHTAFSTLPVITEVAKEQGIRPSRPLSIAVVASQIAITASPISAAVVFFAGILEPLGVSYLTLLAICIPVTLLAVMLTAIVCNFLGCELKERSGLPGAAGQGGSRDCAAARYLSCSRTPNALSCCF